MSVQRSWRSSLEKYFIVAKQYYDEFYREPSPEELFTLFCEPAPLDKTHRTPLSLAKAEQQWLESLLDWFATVEEAVAVLERWRDWSLSLIYELKLSKTDTLTLPQGTEKILGILRSQQMEEGYLRWFIGYTISEFNDTMSKTIRILQHLNNLRPLAQRLQSPLQRSIAEEMGQLLNSEFATQLLQLQKQLTIAYDASTHDTRLRHIAEFLDLLAKWLQQALPPDQNEDVNLFIARIREIRTQCNKLNELVGNFRAFEEARKDVYRIFHQAELSVIRMMLSYEENPETWWRNFLTSSSTEVHSSIPPEVDPNQLIIGVTNSHAFIEEMDSIITSQLTPLVTEIHELAEFLESPTLTFYAKIIQHRLTIWSKYRRQWSARLIELRKGLQQEISV